MAEHKDFSDTQLKAIYFALEYGRVESREYDGVKITNNTVKSLLDKGIIAKCGSLTNESLAEELLDSAETDGRDYWGA